MINYVVVLFVSWFGVDVCVASTISVDVLIFRGDWVTEWPFLGKQLQLSLYKYLIFNLLISPPGFITFRTN